MSFFNKMKDLLLGLYLSPVNNNTRLALSLRNRIMPETLHLNALVFTIQKLVNEKNFGKLILDIGCFDGGTSIFFHNEIKNSKVIGFEAGKQSYLNAIEKTAGIPGIKIENYAVTNYCGIAEFFVTDNKLSSSLNPLTGSDSRFATETTEKVNTITLDEYFKKEGLTHEKVLVLKLDVQGHEPKVLKGAHNTLSKTLFVLIEMSNHQSYRDGAQYYEVDQLLRENGFVLQNIFASYSYGKYLYEYDSIYINQNLL